MSYLGISQAAVSPALRNRVAACVAQEYTGPDHPLMVTDRIQWQCAAEPGWGEAWASALTAQEDLPYEDRTDPGLDPAVIPDAWILTAVQKHLGAAPEPLGS